MNTLRSLLLAVALMCVPATSFAMSYSLPAKQRIVGVWEMQAREANYSFSHRIVLLADGSMTGYDETVIHGEKQAHRYTGVYWIEGNYLMLLTKEDGKTRVEGVEFKLTSSELHLIEKEDVAVLRRVK